MQVSGNVLETSMTFPNESTWRLHKNQLVRELLPTGVGTQDTGRGKVCVCAAQVCARVHDCVRQQLAGVDSLLPPCE